MARNGMKNTISRLIINPSMTKKELISVNERSMSKLVVDKLNPTAENEPRMPLEDLPTSCWVPHPRSGIYFPEGQERVMDDVPDHAATMEKTFWLRNIDGVDDVVKQESFTTANVTQNNNPK